MSLDPALRSRIDTLLSDNRIVLFMKGQPQSPQCGFSAKAVGALNSLGIDYKHVDVLSDPEIREAIKLYGDWPTIPQLYIGGELVGGSDIIEQMANSGELHSALGLPQPDRTPPRIRIGASAIEMLRNAITDAGGDVVVRMDIDAQYRTRLHLAQPDPNAVTAEVDGIRVQFDLAGARRAEGLNIDWADDERGRGLIIDNPNAPKPVQSMTPAQAIERRNAGTLRIVDVRPGEERALASIAGDVLNFDNGLEDIEALPKGTALAFLCHRGGRSQQAAEHFRTKGFREVYNIAGGIDAWADVDSSVAKY
ncbi:Grx4 family monothiol glutaredoxin [Lysobacter sp. A6]|uniref:Grx4 family monothiol glutaredoxin n=1 Tax=Noviluteimonas lactosilytica TaxID=2888523 RepID=A0ABS8JKU0_9GAMM|nr:Grx4 family monothiol glutaredoxin [Lysobacter lactosilyticus]MCC8364240.1 Grx4 family monothiol glutaredoxin [Lysobacter lactosilyticus]